jgi:ribosomal protein S27AE
MACHKAWSRDTLASNFTSKFVTKTYKGRREDLLFERERSLMPATQQYVELEKKSRQLTQQEVQLRVKLSHEEEELGKIRGLSTSVLAVKHGLQNEFEAFLLRQEMVAIQMKVIAPIQIDIGTIQWRNIQMRERIIGRHVEMEKRAFVRACPHDACKGFLSTAWKCGLCENWTCPTCHEVKGPEKDAAHTCDPNNVATAELLARDSRNCPKCAAGIFKINGCDQMWCTQCHTAFSWRTGRVETHMVHNPHYYEYQRAHGTPLPRAVGDVPCGGFPEWSVILKLVGGRQSIQTNGGGVVQEVINAYRSHPHAMY